MTGQFIRGIEKFAKPTKPVIATLGTFDGIHRGHQAIIKTLEQQCRQANAPGVMITFDPHPRVVLSPDHIPLLLTTVEEKGVFVPDFFTGTVLVLEFDLAMKNRTPRQFVQEILVDRLGITKLIVGYDHALGKDRKGNAEELTRLGKEFGFEVEVVGPVQYEGKPVSSSRIRQAMADNKYDQALKLLGHDYAIFGSVERGLGLGRRLGYPTANVRYGFRKLLPPQGVYSCWAEVGDIVRPGMMFIGQNHFNPQAHITVEANLFDFDADIYDENIIVYPIEFIRENRKFDGTDELVKQIEKDKKQIIDMLRKEKDNAFKQRAEGRNNCQQPHA